MIFTFQTRVLVSLAITINTAIIPCCYVVVIALAAILYFCPFFEVVLVAFLGMNMLLLQPFDCTHIYFVKVTMITGGNIRWS